MNKAAQKKSNRSLWITLAVLNVVAVILGVANLALAFLPKGPAKVAQAATLPEEKLAEKKVKKKSKKKEEVVNEDETEVEEEVPEEEEIIDEHTPKKALDELTEEEAVEALIETYAVGYAPEGLLDANLVPTDLHMMFKLGFSYGDLGEISEADNFHTTEQYMGKELEVEPVDESYAVVRSKDYEEMAKSYGKMPIGYTFNNQYLDYRRAEEGESTTEANSSESLVFNTNDAHLEFVDTSTSFIRKALPMVAVAIGPMTPMTTNIYDYAFEKNSDSVTLTLYYLSVDADYENLSEVMMGDVNYVINGYAVGCSVNTKTGEFTWAAGLDDVVPQKIVSLPLSEENVDKIQNAALSMSST